MSQELTLFVGMFTTLLAIINPLEALPVFLELLEGKDEDEHQRVARLSCFYALLLAFFFLFFGHLILWIFGVPLSMVRIVGGIILMRIGFDLFSPSSSGTSMASVASGSGNKDEDVAFVPLAMPIMFGPGAIATILGMTSTVKHSEFVFASAVAICRGHCRDDVRHLSISSLCQDQSCAGSVRGVSTPQPASSAFSSLPWVWD